MEAEAGIVHLVGAGPGDPGLLTLRAQALLARAQVVVYDHLANQELLSACPPGAERIYVGKMAGRHCLPQGEINRLLAQKAREGKVVVRLKGGDPFVFGRGGEEALELARSGIPFTVVPGVTAAVAAAAYAGIPFTHRGLASSAALVTGHEDPSKEESEVAWEQLAAGAGTLAVYMGVKTLPAVAARLMAGGRPASTPAALVRWGTLNRQQTLEATLGEIASLAERQDFGPPAVLLVGEVVALRRELRWFDTRPLFGRPVVVTRSRTQASGLARGLSELGAEVRELPTIEIQPVEEPPGLAEALASLSSFSWLVLTSTNAVELFFRHLEAAGLDARSLAGVRVAAIGGQTASRLAGFGIRADLVPERFTSEAALESFARRQESYAGERFLLPGSEIARDLLPEGLSRLGGEVVRVPLYRNRVPVYTPEELDRVFGEPRQMVTFTSSSTVTHLAEILERSGRSRYLERIEGVCIGPVTAATARERNMRVVLEAQPHTIPGLLQAIRRHFSPKEAQ